MSKEKTAEDLIAVFDKIGSGGTIPAEAAMMAIQSQLKAIDQELAGLNGCKTTFNRHSDYINIENGRLTGPTTPMLSFESWAYIDKEHAKEYTPYPCTEIKNAYSNAYKRYVILRKCGGACRFHNISGLICEGPPEADKVQERVQIRIDELLARRKKLDKILSVCIERLAEDYE